MPRRTEKVMVIDYKHGQTMREFAAEAVKIAPSLGVWFTPFLNLPGMPTLDMPMPTWEERVIRVPKLKYFKTCRRKHERRSRRTETFFKNW